ncbi:hypothetical protein [Legionella pneumophila]|uniref:hypothetical protein n=1 Tax=Legionella pneumophila TaxID=446 RepID=UPI00277C752D|nr:hypothetical protein [Legionella pneumophila]
MKVNISTLKSMSLEELSVFMKTIPEYEKVLDLSNSNLYIEENVNFLLRLLPLIPPTITTLNLSGNFLGYLTDAQLVAVIDTLPFFIRTLNLRDNHFGHVKRTITTEGLLMALGCLEKKNIRSLDLAENNFGLLSFAQKLLILQALPSKLDTLGLAANSLAGLYDDELMALFQTIAPNIKSLNLSNNHFGFPTRHFTHKGLINALRTLKKVTFLDLSDNDLHRSSVDELKEIGPSIPPNVIKIDFSRNNLFMGRESKDRDAILVGLRHPDAPGRALILKGNNEGEFARWAAPFASFFRQTPPGPERTAMKFILEAFDENKKEFLDSFEKKFHPSP